MTGNDGYGYLSRPDGTKGLSRTNPPKPALSAQGTRSATTTTRPTGIPADPAPRIGGAPRLETRRVGNTTREAVIMFSGIDNPDVPLVPWVPDWEVSGATFTPNAAQDPDGLNSAASMIEDSAFGPHGGDTPTSAFSITELIATGVFSGYFKAAGRTNIALAFSAAFFPVPSSGPHDAFAYGELDLTTGVLTPHSSVTGDVTLTELVPWTVTDMGGGWWKVDYSFELEYTGVGVPGFWGVNEFSAAMMTGPTYPTDAVYAGDGVSGILVYRADFSVT